MCETWTGTWLSVSALRQIPKQRLDCCSVPVMRLCARGANDGFVQALLHKEQPGLSRVTELSIAFSIWFD